ncbi:DNA-directed DNA polymerase, partial [Synchytrium microbalum]
MENLKTLHDARETTLAYNTQVAANNSRISDNNNVYKKPDTNRNTRTFKSPATLVCFRCWDMGHSSSSSGCENAVRAFPGFSDQPKDPNIGHKNVAVCVQCWKSGHRKSECSGTSRPFPGIIRVTEAATITRNESSNWLLDGGASHHMTGDASCLVDSRPINNRVFGIGNTSLKVTGIGRVIGRVGDSTIILEDVLLVPNLARNLISEGLLYDQGSNNVYPLDISLHSPVVANVSLLDITTLWHRRLGHPSVNRMKSTLPDIDFDSHLDECRSCIRGKMSEDSYPASKSPKPSVLEVLAADVMGPFRKASRDGSIYYLAVLDIGSHYGWIIPLKNRADATPRIADLIRLLETQYSDCKIKGLQTDNAPEFTGKAMQEFLRSRGIIHRLTMAYSHAQNGAIERYNPTIQEHSKTIALKAHITPYEVLNGKAPTYDNLRIFGCDAICHDPTQLDKQNPRAIDA